MRFGRLCPYRHEYEIMQRIEFDISHEHDGRRLDTVLAALLPGIPHAELCRWLRKGFVRKNGARTVARARLATDDRVQAPIWAPDAAVVRERRGPKQLPMPDIVYEDDDVLFVYKPPGLASHPGIGHDADSLSARLSAHVTVSPGCRVGLAQRLDAGVSGLIPCGKHAVALKALMGPPHGPPLVKLYAAVVTGTPPAAGNIVLPLRATDQPRGDAPKVVVDRVAGKPAHTQFITLYARPDRALVVLRLRTGRTHQIRAHLRAIGHPLLGDPRYGLVPDNERAAQTFGTRRPLLHAGYLKICHPLRHDEYVSATCAPPSDMDAALGQPAGALMAAALADGRLDRLLA